jgi:hypothetical protein
MWTHRKKATRESDRSSNVVREEANIERRTAGVTGKREPLALPEPGAVEGVIVVDEAEDETGMEVADDEGSEG